MIRTAVVVAMVLALDARSADACSCPDEHGTIPGSGSVGVATNLKSVYFWGYGDDAYLVADDLTEVHGQIDRTPSVRVLRLSGALQPNTHYTLLVAGTSRLSASFTTGSAPDLVPPPAPRFDNFRIDWWGRDTDTTCGVRDYEITGYLAAPPGTDIVTMGLRFTSSSGEARETYLWPDSAVEQATGDQVWFPGQLGTSYCLNHFTLEKGETYLVEAWSIDRNGNVSEPVSQTVAVHDESSGCSAGGRQGLGTLVLLAALWFAHGKRRRDRRSHVHPRRRRA